MIAIAMKVKDTLMEVTLALADDNAEAHGSCRVLFSVLVLGTTIQMLCNILEVLIESTPQEIDDPTFESGSLGFPGVVVVHELHFWAITIGRSLLACHILVAPHVDTDEILQAVTDYCEYVHEISRVTIQVEQDHWSSRPGL